jgi:hypothetical protein
LNKPVGKRRFSVVNVRDDAEIPFLCYRYHIVAVMIYEIRRSRQGNNRGQRLGGRDECKQMTWPLRRPSRRRRRYAYNPVR